MSFARVRALAIVGVLVTSAMIFVIFAIVKDNQRGDDGPSGCPEDAVIANLQLPEEEQIKLRIIDASGGTVEAASLATDMKHRGFQVEEAGRAQAVKDVAILRYGPKGVSSAWVVQAYFLGEATDDFQIKREDNVVDLVIGAGFQKLATSTEVIFHLGQNGRPTAPPGTCGDEGDTDDKGSKDSKSSKSGTDATNTKK